jgi:hypothetical protein
MVAVPVGNIIFKMPEHCIEGMQIVTIGTMNVIHVQEKKERFCYDAGPDIVMVPSDPLDEIVHGYITRLSVFIIVYIESLTKPVLAGYIGIGYKTQRKIGMLFQDFRNGIFPAGKIIIVCIDTKLTGISRGEH